MTTNEFFKLKPYHGMKVVCVICDKKILDAKLSLGDSGRWYICQNVFEGPRASDMLGYEYSWLLLDIKPDLKLDQLVSQIVPVLSSDKEPEPLSDPSIVIKQNGFTMTVRLTDYGPEICIKKTDKEK